MLCVPRSITRSTSPGEGERVALVVRLFHLHAIYMYMYTAYTIAISQKVYNTINVIQLYDLTTFIEFTL